MSIQAATAKPIFRQARWRSLLGSIWPAQAGRIAADFLPEVRQLIRKMGTFKAAKTANTAE